ncbi:MAG: heparinase II/III domain-containing protein [Armatimonadota bacterium]
MTGLFFGEPEIAAMRDRMARHRWAARALERIRCGLECRREELLAGAGGVGPLPGTTLLHLALCGRLLDDWHREAAENLLRQADAPEPFTFKQTHDLCLGLDFLDGLDRQLFARVSERILVPLGERCLAEHRGGSNHQTTKNLSLLCLGLLTGRDDFITVVTGDPERSFAYHLAHGVHPDGIWYEQCMGSYHTGTLDRFLRTRWVADRHGIALGGDEVILKMLDTIPGMALPGGVLPRIGDVSGEPGQGGMHRGSLFELAYAMYEVPWVGWALGRMPREDLWSLLVGREIGAAETPEPRSRLFDAAGLCVLKQGAGASYWEGTGSGATITFGPHGDWHGHAGKLGIEYVHDGRCLVRDHGNSAGYSHPIHRLWFMTTLAHSTVVLDEHNQAFTWTRDRPELERNETGRCHAHLFRDDVSACTVSADFAYPGCSLRRTLFLTADYLLDITECEGRDGEEHTFDWLLHTGGVLQSELPFMHSALACANKGAVPSPPDRTYSPGALAPSSYDYLREIEACETAERWSVDVMDAKWAADIWKIGGRAMRLTMLGAAGTTVFKGVCPAAARDVYDPVVLVRRRAKRTAFIALHVPGNRQLDLECLVNAGGAIACRVTAPGAAADILVKQDGDETIEVGGRAFSGRLAFCGGERQHTR